MSPLLSVYETPPPQKSQLYTDSYLLHKAVTRTTTLEWRQNASGRLAPPPRGEHGAPYAAQSHQLALGRTMAAKAAEV